MKQQTLLIKMLLALAPVAIGSLAFSEEKKEFVPSTEPVFNTAQAKPNILMVLDDSSSMHEQDIYLPEHAEGFGQPHCSYAFEYWIQDYWGRWVENKNRDSEQAKKDINNWIQERQRNGEYNPFHNGLDRYEPWDDEKAAQGLYGNLKKPPVMPMCKKSSRASAMSFAYKSLMRKYKDKAYLGVSFLWQTYEAKDHKRNQYGYIVADRGSSVLRLPLNDYSKWSENDFENKVINRIADSILLSPGNTPMYPGVYEAIKMFRGEPLTRDGTNGSFAKITPYAQIEEKNGKLYYDYVQHATPLRYRCQQNHMIVMTDGEPNDFRAYGINEKDGLKRISDKYTYQDRRGRVWEDRIPNGAQYIQNDMNFSKSGELTGEILGKISATTDLRSSDIKKPVQKGVGSNGQWIWANKDKDDAGKPWNDSFSIPMPINIHSVSLFVDPHSDIYTTMTSRTSKIKDQRGFNLGFGAGKGNAGDLLSAFDTIFSSIIKSTSSTKAMNDKANADILFGTPKKGDLASMGAIRYDTTYNFRQQFGTIRAMVPYITHWDTDSFGKKTPQMDAAGKPKQATLELWNTDQTVKSNQGRYITLGGLLKDEQVIRDMNTIYQAAYPKSDNAYDKAYVKWLTDHEVTAHAHNLRGRLTPIGSVTNSDIKLANKDELYIDVTSKKMGSELSESLIQWLLFKAKNQPVNHLVVGDNNGFINFINSERGLSKDYKAGERNTAYFPKMLASRIDHIAKIGYPAALVMEGRTNFVDAKVGANKYATIGLTSMGSGGKGLVGYSIFEGTGNGKSFSTVSKEIKPLFEITNEGPKEFRTKGFENLGYTYSGFEFFNKTNPLNGVKVGQAVAVFGNGFGAQKSSIYFIDAYTGEKIREIVLNPQGGGASTPSMLVRAEGAGQMVDRIYVGDYSGTLYRVDFNGKGLKDSDVTVTALFKAPNTGFGQSAISIKPLLLKNDITGKVTVYFGTGMAASKELDRGDKSLVEHSIYAVVDSNQTSAASTAKADVMNTNNASVLSPILTQSDLSPGKVEYAKDTKVNYTDSGTYELDIQAPLNIYNKDGWYLRLIADGEKSGERVIQEPKYDARHKAITFSTWGVHEREGGKPIDGLEDPCLSDAAFGKSLAIEVKTGGASNKIGLSNRGKTNNAPGGLTGDELYAAPEGNSVTKIDDIKKLDAKVAEELIVAVGEENSTHATDPEGYAAYCEGDLTGGLECSVYDRSALQQLDPQRIGIQKIFSF